MVAQLKIWLLLLLRLRRRRRLLLLLLLLLLLDLIIIQAVAAALHVKLQNALTNTTPTVAATDGTGINGRANDGLCQCLTSLFS